VFHGRPIIGIVGGIGSGKSTVARAFADLGCLVIDSDALVTDVYNNPQVQDQLRQWWGDAVIASNGQIDRSEIARRIFADDQQRNKLEHLLHPLVEERRRQIMAQAANNAQIKAYVWDTPLLFESSLNQQCDAIVFVDAPRPVRLSRVRQNRGWNDAQLAQREKLQWPLDKKREISDYVIDNTADAELIRGQVADVLSQIRARLLQDGA
jgi:dephospho-CoA kinase